ncbi:MAG: MBL fold metallo-hydrolase [Zoogloeaceae bacterium]|nr:MBL fold metallo-hydrolase [Zoogloeaceae bacterium]
MRYAILPVTPFEQNCTVFWCEVTGEAVVLDPGGEIPRIRAFLAEERLKLAAILVTHGHIDHVGGVADLLEVARVPVWGPQAADRFWIEQLPVQSRMFGFAEARVFEPERWLEEGDTVSFGRETLNVLHCPGHTPGHVVFYHPGVKLLHAGDVLFKGSVGRTDFPQGNTAALLRSIKEKIFPLGDEFSVIAGHGPMTTLGDERRFNPFVGESGG